MTKFGQIFATLVISSFIFSAVPNTASVQNSFSKISWQENVFFKNQEFKWQYQDVSFNGAIEVICPCENDSVTIIIEKDLSELNLVNKDANNINSYITQLFMSEGLWYNIDNSSLILDLEGIPFIYPVIREYDNGSRINWLEYLVENQPVTNYTDILYTTRRIENGYYIQRKVFSTNPWFRFETRIDLKTGVMASLWFEEGFFSIISQGFSHIYNLTLITDIPEIKGQSAKSKGGLSNININSSYIGLIFIVLIVKYKFRKKA